MPNYIIVLLCLATAIVLAITHVYISRVIKTSTDNEARLKAAGNAYNQLATLNEEQRQAHETHTQQCEATIRALRQALAVKPVLDVLYVWQKPDDFYGPACVILTYAASITEARANAQQGYIDYRRMRQVEPDATELEYVNARFFKTPVDTVDLLAVGATVIDNVPPNEEPQ